MAIRFIYTLLVIVLISYQINAQDCKTILLASKSFPSADNKIIWKSNRPAEYLFPGEKIHVLVTGQMNYMPKKHQEDKGGVFGLFTNKVEWVEDNWQTPKSKPPKSFNIHSVPGSIRLNDNGNYECDLTVDLDAEGLTKPTSLEITVLTETELSGDGGELTTGEYEFKLTIDNSVRLQMVKNEIVTRLNGWGSLAVENLQKIIDKDDRLKCTYHDELAITILRATSGIANNLKQQILQYATSLSPQNHDIIIELAQTYTGLPGGCDKQKEALTNNGITQINVDPNNFDVINNSAKAFDILASAYFECTDDFRDAKSVDSLRSFYRLASNQYGMTFNYPKQIAMAIRYANAELDYNDKNEIQNAAGFLEDIRESVPQNIDSVGEEERRAFFGKFGNTQFVEYKNIEDSIVINLEQKNNPSHGAFFDEIKLTIKKRKDSSIRFSYKYIDKYSGMTPTGVRQKTYSIDAIIDKGYKITSFKVDTSTGNPADLSSLTERLYTDNITNIKKKIPTALSALFRLIDISRFCPTGLVSNSNHVSHTITHSLGSFSLLYYTNEQNYSIDMAESLPFIIMQNSALHFSEKQNTPESSKNKMVLNMDASPIFGEASGSGIDWKPTESTGIKFH